MTLPKNFTSGERLFASDLNNNFEHLEDEIDSFKPDYIYDQTVEFLSSGTFTKANYPNARMFVFRIQGGGGGGGGFTSGQVRAGSGGGGGGFAVVAKTPASLSASETITVGLGGNGGADSVSGTSGGTSSAAGASATGGGHGRNFNNLNFQYGGAPGGPSGTRHYGATGVRGGNLHRPSTTNCVDGNIVGGWGGMGGCAEYRFIPFVFDFDESPGNRTYSFNLVAANFEYNASGISGPGPETPRTSNGGDGGTSAQNACAPSFSGYGTGGNNGFVKVDIYV